MAVADLSNLPDISYAPATAKETETSIITKYEELSGITLEPADPVRLFLEALAYTITVQNNLIDLAGKQNLLKYATGAHLEHLGALMGVTRLPAQAATCTLTFTLSEALDFDVPIPAGTRVGTSDQSIIFATLSDATILAGDLSVEAPAQSTTTGAKLNGLVAGQVNQLIDRVPYVASAQNSDVTTYGDDEESDESLRNRIRLAPESFTTAGPSGQYEAIVYNVSSQIEEVVCYSPEPGKVDIRFTMTGGELPDDAMIEMVSNALNAEDVRPLTDYVTVQSPDPVEYDIEVKWYITNSDSVKLTTIQDNVAKAVEEYRLWQREKPGRDINPSKLVQMMVSAGAKRVEVTAPDFTSIKNIEIARENTINVTFAGQEDE